MELQSETVPSLIKLTHTGPCNVPAIHTVRLRFRELTLHDLD